MSSRYPLEFKQKAINLVTLERKSITQVSLELGLSKGTLYYWLNHQSPGSMALRTGRPGLCQETWTVLRSLFGLTMPRRSQRNSEQVLH